MRSLLQVKNPKIAHPQVSQIVFSIVIYSYRNVILTTAICQIPDTAIFGGDGSRNEKRHSSECLKSLISLVGTTRFELVTSTVSG